MTSTCTYCDYEWESKVETPKACPRCKRRLDFGKVMESEDEGED